MNESTPPMRTPVRGVPSNLARNDLLRRVKRLALPEEAVPRVVRFLEKEIEEAVAARSERCFSAAEIEKANPDGEVLEALRRNRLVEERIEAIRKAGLADLSPDELEGILAEVRSGRS